MARVMMDTGKVDIPRIMEARRTTPLRGVYIAQTTQSIWKYHANPACFNLMKSPRSKVIRTNVFKVERGDVIYIDPDTTVLVRPCKCVDKPRDNDRSWMKHAACSVPGMDLSEYFVRPGSDTSVALALCVECPVRLHCRDYGATEDRPRDVAIIWGGEVHRGRKRS